MSKQRRLLMTLSVLDSCTMLMLNTITDIPLTLRAKMSSQKHTQQIERCIERITERGVYLDVSFIQETYSVLATILIRFERNLWPFHTEQCGHSTQSSVAIPHRAVWPFHTEQCGHSTQSSVAIPHRAVWPFHTEQCGQPTQSSVAIPHRAVWPFHTEQCGHSTQSSVAIPHRAVWPFHTEQCGQPTQSSVAIPHRAVWPFHTEQCGHSTQSSVAAASSATTKWPGYMGGDPRTTT